MIELNKIYNEDCMQTMSRLPDKSIDLIVTDPPYEVTVNGGNGNCCPRGLTKSLTASLRDNDISNGYDIVSVNSEFIRIMKNINIYIWCNIAQVYDYLQFYVGQYKCAYSILTWHKTNTPPTYSNKYLTDTEYCLYFHKNAKCSPYNYDSAKTYYISKKEPERNDNWGHPTQKPVEFIERMIRNSSDVGDVVYDPFMGSGTTAVACVRNGRKYIGSEINHKFYSASVERLVAAGDNTVNVNDECRLW